MRISRKRPAAERSQQRSSEKSKQKSSAPRKAAEANGTPPKRAQTQTPPPVEVSRSEALARLESVSGELSSAILRALGEQLGWYRRLSAADRSAIGMVAQSGVSSFTRWFARSSGSAWVAADIFHTAPRSLARKVSLQQTLQVVKVSVSVLESFIGKNDPILHVAALEYSRDVAFAAADAYARAAEERGLWDSRLEALVVDTIVSGEYEEDLPSRVSALGWHSVDEVLVLVGPGKPSFNSDRCRRIAARADVDILIGVQGKRVVIILGRAIPKETASRPHPLRDVAAQLVKEFGKGRVVLGPLASGLDEANTSATAAMAAYAVADLLRTDDRLVSADDLLPERALNGDPLACATLITHAYRPLQEHSTDMLDTLDVYLGNGRSLEATSRTLFVHPNTVRYRLHRVAELVGWDPTDARDALVLQTACILGRIDDTQNR